MKHFNRILERQYAPIVSDGVETKSQEELEIGEFDPLPQRQGWFSSSVCFPFVTSFALERLHPTRLLYISITVLGFAVGFIHLLSCSWARQQIYNFDDACKGVSSSAFQWQDNLLSSQGWAWDPLAVAKSNPNRNLQALSDELGPSADRSYNLDLGNNIHYYQHVLEDFIQNYFPEADSDETNPDSLINHMRTFFPCFPGSSSFKNSQPYCTRQIDIPKTIFRTAASDKVVNDRGEVDEERLRWQKSWDNKGYNITFHNSSQANEWVHGRFQGTRTVGAFSSSLPSLSENSPIVKAWDLLESPPILRSDLWRYLIVAVEGGVYTDTDTEALKPFEKWGESPSWADAKPSDYVPPSIIVGVETDVRNRTNFFGEFSHPIQIVQWTFASAKGHPVLIDAIRRVVLQMVKDESASSTHFYQYMNDSQKDGHPNNVIHRTGPAPFTDAVFQYLLVKWGKRWDEFRRLSTDGWRYKEQNEEEEEVEGHWGDLRLLHIAGFSPDIHIDDMGSRSGNDPAAMVRHAFRGSWRSQQGAEGRSRLSLR